MNHIFGLFKSSSQMDSSNESIQSAPSGSVNPGNHTSTVEDILSSLYRNDLHTDVIFNVRCGDSFVSFSCHKLILSLWSPVFAEMFSNVPPSVSGCKQTVEVSEVPPSAFEALVEYCYGSKTLLEKNRGDVNCLLKAYKAAMVFEIKSLQLLCAKMFECAAPTKENVFELLHAAKLTSSEGLKDRCFAILQSQTNLILAYQDLASVTPSVINTLLNMKSLALESEYELLEWIFDWGVKEYTKCQERNQSTTFKDIMRPFLPRLNFISLKPKQFGELVKKHKDFFNEGEITAVFMNIVCPGSWNLPKWHDSSNKIARSFSKSE